ncbi:hypothetical protein ACFSZS_01050 [Seohaeicola zhoushanensis]
MTSARCVGPSDASSAATSGAACPSAVRTARLLGDMAAKVIASGLAERPLSRRMAANWSALFCSAERMRGLSALTARPVASPAIRVTVISTTPSPEGTS